MSDAAVEDREIVTDPTVPQQRKWHLRTLAAIKVTVVIASGLVLFTWLLNTLSAHVFAANSDGATVVLEGQSISAGHLLLQGWGLSRDSFWSIDALFYALFVAVDGVKHEALHIVPGLIVALIVMLGLWFVREEDRTWRSWVGFVPLILIIGVPNPVLSFFLLQGPWHVGTALWCLIAFGGLASGRWRLGWAIAIVALCAGMLGDLETIPFGVVPVVLAGLIEIAQHRSWRKGLPSVTAGVVASGLAWAVRALVRHGGGFAIATGVTQAVSNRYLTNIGHAFSWMTGLFGVSRLAIGPSSTISADARTNGSLLSHLAHIPLLVLVVICVVNALAVLINTLIRGSANSRRTDQSLRIDALLLFGTVGSIASFVVLCPNNNADYARYLSSAVICASILSARTAARWLGSIQRNVASVAVGLLLGVVACGVGLSVSNDLSHPPAPTPTAALAKFLEGHHLTIGVGDYWSASIVTVVSDDQVVVRPVITKLGGAIVRYERQSSSNWYAGVPFQFLVYNVRHPWRDINATTAITSFGRPKVAYVVGNYRVIVWPHPLTISPKGFTRG